jgi:hypothetical protein
MLLVGLFSIKVLTIFKFVLPSAIVENKINKNVVFFRVSGVLYQAKEAW